MYADTWPRYPSIFEINTWVWLNELSQKHGTPVHLGSVPAAEWDSIAEFGFHAVWLMGVWERSPAGTAIANRNPGLLDSFRRALPDFQPSDNVGSPYCVRRYVVDQTLGGPEGLAAARRELANRGMRLILDFVPNHTAPDHPWTREHPAFFIRGTAEDVQRDPASFLEINGSVLACGRDPYFPAWPDVVQLNAFDPGLRHAVAETLKDIASQSDGVRCDMAMLLLNPIFSNTWGRRAGQWPEREYWAEVIPPVKADYPNFLFIAEAYWDKEWDLQQLGFDFCYDKRLYDRLEHDNAESIRLHLCADPAYQRKLVRFIENHDEPRAAATFGPDKARAAAVVMATLTGARLFHQGQFESRKVRLPVFLGRAPQEPIDEALGAFYRGLLTALRHHVFKEGDWVLCDRTGWPDNASFENLVCWAWVGDNERYVIVVNLSGGRVQARVRIPWDDIHGQILKLEDALSGAVFDRSGDEMGGEGLYVDLPGWGYHFLECRRMSQAVAAPA